MNVLILVSSYPPVVESAGRLYSQLAESLVAAGHRVTVVSEFPGKHVPVDKDHGFWKDPQRDGMLGGVRVRRVSPLNWLSYVPGGKVVRFFLSCALFAARGLRPGGQDVILVYSPPLFMGIAGWFLSLWHCAPMAINVQDLHPKVLFDSGAIRNPLFKSILLRMEALNYRHARAFIVYSEGNRQYLLRNGVRGPVYVIPNWVDTSEIESLPPGSRFREAEAIGPRFLVSYAGTMQSAQGLDVVVRAAAILRQHENIVFFLAGEGAAKRDLERQVNELRLGNVLIRAVMPAEEYLRCLEASDVCLVTLSEEVPLETVPGKLAYTLACGRPVLAAVNLHGDAAKVVEAAKGGICVASGDAASFAEAVLSLSRDPALCLELGRRAKSYAEANFAREACTTKYEHVLAGLAPFRPII